MIKIVEISTTETQNVDNWCIVIKFDKSQRDYDLHFSLHVRYFSKKFVIILSMRISLLFN